MPIEKIKLRIKQLIAGEGVSKVEIWNALFAFAHGLFFMLPFSTFNTLPENSLLRYENKFWYGLILLVVGTIKFGVVFYGNFYYRKTTAGVISIVWFTIFSQLLLFAPQSPTMAAALVLSGMAASVFWRL